ncbi:MAG: IPT/TIG domain-containing protein [Cyclobacteriaceae bacterium]
MKQLIKKVLIIPFFFLTTLSCENSDGGNSNEQLSPIISSVDPTFGAEGTPVTITGSNFSKNSAEITIKFNETLASEVFFASVNQISTKVPVGATTGTVTVTVLDQTVEGPIFSVNRGFSVTPTVGMVGTEVILMGDNFSSVASENVVRFNGTQAVVNSASQTEISVNVPEGATTGPVTVTVNGTAIEQQGADFIVSGIEETPVNYKIAFIGDSDIHSEADAVLNLIKNEGADAVVHAGDLNYDEIPSGFESHINETLGENFPYFYCVGNHDDAVWNGPNGYQSLLEARFNRLGIIWSGQLGVQGAFNYKGIFFVMTAPDEFGITSATSGDHIRNELDNTNAVWRISFWHKNQRLMQIGGKSNEAGWNVYEESRKGGAIIATGHEHSYSRTHEMSDFQNQTISSTENTVNLMEDDASTNDFDEGRSFAFVSGLGGKSIRDAESGLDQNPWWADVFHSNNGGQYGALFGEFNYNGDETLARFYFKDISGTERDEFFVRSKVNE